MPGVADSGDAGLRAVNARLRELLAERDAEIAVLREQMAALQSQVADLDKKVRHRSARCACCGKSLKRAPVTGMERRQATDIPPVRAVTTGHQMLTLLCGCGCETKAQAPAGATAPVQYGPRIMGTGTYLWHGQFLSRDRACRALSEMFGCAPPPGALAAAAKKTAGLLAPALQAITKHLIASEVVHFDETGFRTAGRLAWVHSASWGKFVLSPSTPSGARTG
jgi:transposase